MIYLVKSMLLELMMKSMDLKGSEGDNPGGTHSGALRTVQIRKFCVQLSIFFLTVCVYVYVVECVCV